MGEDRFSYGYKYRIDPTLASFIFVGFMLTLAGITYATRSIKTFMPVVSTFIDVFDWKIILNINCYIQYYV